MHWLKNRVAVITGASRGIGAATAEAIAAAGAHVVLAARDDQALRRVADRIRDTGGRAARRAGLRGRGADARAVRRDDLGPVA